MKEKVGGFLGGSVESIAAAVEELGRASVVVIVWRSVDFECSKDI